VGLLAGCQQPPPPVVVAPPPPLPPHLGPPPAALCTVAPFKVADGGTADVSMTLSNDGGYCAAQLTASDGQPFDAGLVPARPPHGKETVIHYNHKTSIEYIAEPGYVGPDGFTVKLIHGAGAYTTLNIHIDVKAVSAKTS
jgi:hypothetical protein